MKTSLENNCLIRICETVPISVARITKTEEFSHRWNIWPAARIGAPRRLGWTGSGKSFIGVKRYVVKYKVGLPQGSSCFQLPTRQICSREYVVVFVRASATNNQPNIRGRWR